MSPGLETFVSGGRPTAEESMHDVKTKPVDAGLAALVTLMRFQGVAAEPDQIQHRFGGVSIGLTEMLRCAKDFGLKARVAKTGWARLAASPLPAIGCLGNGGFLVIGKASDDQVLVSDPSVGRPEMLTRAAFEERWTAASSSWPVGPI